MQFNHYGGSASQLAADLVNATPALTAAALELILTARGVIYSQLTDEQAAALQTWSRRLAGCFGPQELSQRCQAVNALLDDAASRPHISLHDGNPHLHYGGDGADPVAHIRAVTAAGLAYVICFAGPARLGRCARTVCRRAFVDTSRNGRRTYCSVRCANNDAVSRHRHR